MQKYALTLKIANKSKSILSSNQQKKTPLPALSVGKVVSLVLLNATKQVRSATSAQIWSSGNVILPKISAFLIDYNFLGCFFKPIQFVCHFAYAYIKTDCVKLLQSYAYFTKQTNLACQTKRSFFIFCIYFSSLGLLLDRQILDTCILYQKGFWLISKKNIN